jgi:uncharacterized protein
MSKLSRRARISIFVSLVLVAIIGLVVLVSAKAYDYLSIATEHYPATTPTGKFEDVTFPSRGLNYEVHAFYMPGEAGAGAPALINVHGWRGSRHSEPDMNRAIALRALGYNVLSIDLQDNGGDTVEDGRLSMGYKERYDVLGAFDYLLERGFASDKIGLVGVSMGASSSLMAAGLDPRLKAIWEDSGYTRADSVLTEQASADGIPTFIVPTGMLWGMLLTGDRMWEVTPIDYAANFAANKQAVYIVHDEHDTLVFFHNGVDMNAAFQKAGVDVTFWDLPDPDLGHVGAVTKYPDEYYRRLDEFFKKHLNWS